MTCVTAHTFVQKLICIRKIVAVLETTISSKRPLPPEEKMELRKLILTLQLTRMWVFFSCNSSTRRDLPLPFREGTHHCTNLLHRASGPQCSLYLVGPGQRKQLKTCFWHWRTMVHAKADPDSETKGGLDSLTFFVSTDVRCVRKKYRFQKSLRNQ